MRGKYIVGLCVAVSMVSACDENVPDAPASANKGVSPAEAEAQSAPAASGAFRLAGPVPPDACEILAAANPSGTLGSEGDIRPRGAMACQFVSTSQGVTVNLSLLPVPLESLDSRRDDAGKLAAAIAEVSMITAPPKPAGKVADLQAFVRVDRDNVLLVPTRVMTTEMTGNEEVAEIVAGLSLQSKEPLDGRAETLRLIASNVIVALRNHANANR